MFAHVCRTVCVLAALSFSATVSNATTFSAATSGAWLGDPFSVSGPMPIIEIRNGSREIGANIQTQRGEFRADGGGLGVVAYVNSDGYPSVNEFTANVGVLYDDIIFSVEPDRTDIIVLPNETIDVFVNLSLDGLINLSPSFNASAQGSISIQVNNVTVGSYQVSHIDSGGMVTVTEVGTGVLDTSAGDQVGIGFGVLLTVPINTPVDLRLGAIATALVNGPTGQVSFADVDFFNTLEFDPNQTFTLPDGFTVNSVSAGIVDNQVVPEPSSVLLLATGVLMLSGAHRRRRES